MDIKWLCIMGAIGSCAMALVAAYAIKMDTERAIACDQHGGIYRMIDGTKVCTVPQVK